MAQQDDYYYEIQLTNKQLVFYFMAGATGLILSFLAGVMVGRGVDQTGEVQARTVQEDKVVTEEAPSPAPSAESYSYARRLEGDKIEEKLEKPGEASPAPEARPGKGGPAPAGSPAPAAPSVSTAAEPAPGAKASPAARPAAKGSPAPEPSPARAAKASPAPEPSPAAKAGDASRAGKFTIQVGAFKDKASAESVVGRLKGKGYAAYVVASDTDNLFNVRVGNYAARPDAEKVQTKLREEEKFKPFIVKQ